MPPAARPAPAGAPNPVAIIDIGSNSVRLVVFDGLDRSPTPAFNEKVLCGLGHGVVSTGKLPRGGVERALAALRRFRALTAIMGVADVRVIATAAARDASNGSEFLAAAGEALGGTAITLLSGPREAQLSAYGVIAGVAEPDGVVGDLGGGSLEIIDIRQGRTGVGVSLPLGGLALMDASKQARKAAARIVRDALARCDALDALAGRTFFAVGGTWRSIAKLHMGQRGYPLMVMHGYAIPAREAAELASLIERTDANSLVAVASVNAARRPLLAYGAVVLDELIRRAKPSEIVISTYGVREGLLYEALDPATRDTDPLLAASAKLNRLLARSPDYADELIAWLSTFVASLGLPEPRADRRLRDAACYLSEVNWRAHPDYRGVQSFNLVSSAILPGVDHAGRAFLSLAATLRYVGLDEAATQPLQALMPPAMIERAQIVGACLRVASVLAGGMPGVLGRTRLQASKTRVGLVLARPYAALAGERLDGRMKALAKLVGRDFAVTLEE